MLCQRYTLELPEQLGAKFTEKCAIHSIVSTCNSQPVTSLSGLNFSHSSDFLLVFLTRIPVIIALSTCTGNTLISEGLDTLVQEPVSHSDNYMSLLTH